MTKRAGWVNQHAVGLYLKDETPPLEEEESAEIFALGEDSGGEDNDILVTSTSENCHKMEDEATDATAGESFVADSIDPSDGNSSCSSTQWSKVVNGTLYIGNVPHGRRPVIVLDDKAEIVAETLGETTKERNRRLLAQHRETQRLSAKVGKSRHSSKRWKYKGKLREIREEGVTAETIRHSTEEVNGLVEGGFSADDAFGENNSMSCYRLREVEIIIRRKVSGFSNSRSGTRQNRIKIKVRGPSVRGTVYGSWRSAV